MPLLRPASTHPRFRPLTVAEVKPVAEHAVDVAFDVSAPELASFLDYTAGQYVTLSAEIAGERVRQSYSLWTRPDRARQEGLLRIAVAEVSGGRMSPWLVSTARPGDVIDVLPPLGEFTYAAGATPTGKERHVVVAGGSGITPVLAITAEILAEPAGHEVHVVLANRTRASSVLRGELSELAPSSGGRLTVTDVLSREDVPGARHGRIDGPLLTELVGEGATDVCGWWLCGPAGLLEAAETWLADQAVPPELVHRERFTSTGPVDPRPAPQEVVSGDGPRS